MSVYRKLHWRDRGPNQSILRSSLRPSLLPDTLFALQEFLYKCALFAERTHYFLIGATLPPLSIPVNFVQQEPLFWLEIDALQHNKVTWSQEILSSIAFRREPNLNMPGSVCAREAGFGKKDPNE